MYITFHYYSTVVWHSWSQSSGITGRVSLRKVSRWQGCPHFGMLSIMRWCVAVLFKYSSCKQ